MTNENYLQFFTNFEFHFKFELLIFMIYRQFNLYRVSIFCKLLLFF